MIKPGQRFTARDLHNSMDELCNRNIKKFITPERVWPYRNNPEWILHSSDQNGNDSRVMLMEKQVRQLFGDVPCEPEDYILASQISQAEAKKYFNMKSNSHICECCSGKLKSCGKYNGKKLHWKYIN